MKVSRTVKENVLAYGFLILSIGVFVILALGAWRGATSHLPAPAPENMEK